MGARIPLFRESYIYLSSFPGGYHEFEDVRKNETLKGQRVDTIYLKMAIHLKRYHIFEDVPYI